MKGASVCNNGNIFNSVSTNSINGFKFSGASLTTTGTVSTGILGSGTILTGSGNVGIGSSTSGARMTILSNGSVSFNLTSSTLVIKKDKEMDLFNIVVQAAIDYKISGKFASDLYELLQICGGNNESILKNFESLRDLLRGKIPRDAEYKFYDLLETRIKENWTLSFDGDLFEKI